MQQVSVEAKVPQRTDAEGNIIQEELSAAITVPFAETIEEAIDTYGEEALLSNAWANGRVVIQAGIRNALKRGETEEQIQANYSGWKLGVATQGSRVDPKQAFLAMFKNGTKEEQDALLAELMDRAKDV